jgi:hypothetical protein
MLAAEQLDDFTYRRRVPEQELLHRMLAEHLETFLDRTRTEDHELPRHVEQELRDYVECGALGAGFVRLKCPARSPPQAWPLKPWRRRPDAPGSPSTRLFTRQLHFSCKFEPRRPRRIGVRSAELMFSGDRERSEGSIRRSGRGSPDGRTLTDLTVHANRTTL